jgi:hypothetical protein
MLPLSWFSPIKKDLSAQQLSSIDPFPEGGHNGVYWLMDYNETTTK